MVLYADTSALLKRAVVEAESTAVRAVLVEANTSGELVTASALAWLEVWRALRRAGIGDVRPAWDQALSGIASHPMTPDVLVRARGTGPASLRTLDAVHLTSALTVGATRMLTYDARLATAAEAVGIQVLSPG